MSFYGFIIAIICIICGYKIIIKTLDVIGVRRQKKRKNSNKHDECYIDVPMDNY